MVVVTQREARERLEQALHDAHRLGVKLYEVRDIAHAIWKIPIDQCDDDQERRT